MKFTTDDEGRLVGTAPCPHGLTFRLTIPAGGEMDEHTEIVDNTEGPVQTTIRGLFYRMMTRTCIEHGHTAPSNTDEETP